VIHAGLFDVDGTLYHQPPLRVLMAGELGAASWIRTAPWNVPRLWRMLSPVPMPLGGTLEFDDQGFLYSTASTTRLRFTRL